MSRPAKIQLKTARKRFVALYDACGDEIIFMNNVDRWLEDARRNDWAFRLYGTRVVQIALDADTILREACAELYHGAFDAIGDDAVAELQQALDAWCAKYGSATETVTADRSVRVVVE